MGLLLNRAGVVIGGRGLCLCGGREVPLLPGESKRLVVESPWSQFTSECQRF
jgi:hypothetical protein